MMGPSATLAADPTRRAGASSTARVTGSQGNLPCEISVAPRQLSESGAAGAMLLGAHTGAGSRPGKDNSRT